jgi:hypothetical protein
MENISRHLRVSSSGQNFGFSDLAKPLTNPTWHKQTFQWAPEAENSFETLKGALCNARIAL